MIEHVGTGRFSIPAELDGSRYDLVAEFMRAPLARHSEDLQLMLARMRSDTGTGRLVLLREAGGRLVVAEPPLRRGDRWREIAEVESAAEAERLAFALRFETHTGTRLAQAGPQAPAGPPPIITRTRQLLGYADPLSVAPGDEVSCHLSAAQAGQADIDLVRMRSGDDGPGAPGLRYDVLSTAVTGCYDVAPHPVRPGGYAAAPLGTLSPGAAVTLQVTFCPTLRAGSSQTLISLDGCALVLGADHRVAIEIRDGDTMRASATADAECGLWQWYTAVGTWSADGLTCRLYDAPGGDELATVGPLPGPVPAVGGGREQQSTLLLAARAGADGPTDHFNGRLEQPAVVLGPLTAAETAALARPGQPLTALPAALAGRVLGWWDFSQQPGGWSVPDRGPRAAAAILANLPRRAVTGSRWDGSADAWPQAPGQFAAAHFLRDGIEDCRWPATVTCTVPAQLRSGCYAFRVRASGEEDGEKARPPGVEELVPFFVRRAVGAAPARRVLVLIPTATYLSYGNSRFWWEDPIQEAVSDRLVELGPEDMHLMTHPELGPSAYDVHDDGTDVTHVSHRRPNLFMRVTNRHFEGYVSDLYLIDWLEQTGADYEVATDDDLNAFGGELLDGVQVVLTGTHPEYITAREYDALAEFQQRGGRLMYLGGNGFHSRVSFCAERPWVMENRRVPYWKSTHHSAAAEHLLSSDGLPGGHLATAGRPALQLVGVETATMGFDESLPFWRAGNLPTAARFVFAGVPGTEIGAFGLIGGGVVGQEWDNAGTGDPLPDGHVILASSRDHSMIPPMFGASREPYHADMVLVVRDGGGACLSVGTMAWCAALSHNGYQNNVAQITGNVLARFLDPRPLQLDGQA
jgi:N,N-dimethylformamidase